MQDENVLFEKKILSSTGLIERIETYRIIRNGDIVEHHYMTENELGEQQHKILLIQTKTKEQFNKQCHLCERPATRRISVGNEHEYYCDYHATEVLRRLMLYKPALRYWCEEVYNAKKNLKN